MHRLPRNIQEEANRQYRRRRRQEALGYGCILLAVVLAIIFFV